MAGTADSPRKPEATKVVKKKDEAHVRVAPGAWVVISGTKGRPRRTQNPQPGKEMGSGPVAGVGASVLSSFASID